MVSATIIAAVMTIVFTAFSILIGLAYRNLKNRIAALEDESNTHAQTTNGLSEKVETLWRWAFGRADDETDGGLAQEINNGFERIEDDIDEFEKRQETYHEMEMEQLRRLVNQLHDEDELEFERDDVFDED